VHYQHPIQPNPEVADQRSDRLARFVHESERPRQDGAVPVEVDLGYLGANPGRFLETDLMALGKRRDRVTAQVVPRMFVALARVTQPDNECR
jgi:hypothetical protein